ncbi:MAG: hypothetical protein ABIP03_06050 [Aquihabitans sp.]
MDDQLNPLTPEVTRLTDLVTHRDAEIRNLRAEAVAKDEAHDNERQAWSENYRQRAGEIAAERDAALHEVVELRRRVVGMAS